MRIKKYILLLTILILGQNLSAQSFIDTDSILNVAKKALKITERINAINDYAFELRRKEPQTGERIADSIYNITKAINYKEGEADYFALKGTFLFPTDLDSSEYYLKKSIPIFKQLGNRDMKLSRAYFSLASINIKKSDYNAALFFAKLSNYILDYSDYKPDLTFYYRIGNNFKVIGDAYYYLGIIDSSITNYIIAENILKHTGDKSSISLCLMNSANVFSLNSQYYKAIEKLKLAINFKKELLDYQGLIQAYSNIGNILSYDNKFNEAKLYIDSAMTLAKEKGIKSQLPANYLGLGFIAMEQNECKNALKIFKRGLVYAIENENEFCRKSLNVSIGEALFCLNDIKNAIKYYEASLNDKDPFKDNELQAYQGLSECYEKLEDFDNAFIYMKKHKSLNDSLYTLKKDNVINTLQNKYEVKEKVKEIKILSVQKKIEESNTQQEYLQKIIVITILAFFILLVLIIFRIYRKSKIIEEQEAVNKERLRIARDLHDDLGATISSISIYSSAVKQKLIEKNIVETGKFLDRISEDAQEMVTGMSDMLWTISSDNNTVEKLTDRLHSYGSGLMQVKEIHFTLNCQDKASNIKLSIELRRNIFLIFKEAINNAVKYSEASKAYLNVFLIENSLVFEFSDNGKGFEYSKFNSVSIGNGLKNMQQRANEINMNLQIQSQFDQGTFIRLTIPLPKYGEN